jgi:transposase
VFVDESGFLTSPTRATTWAPRGKTPILNVRGRGWKKVSAIAALTIGPGRPADGAGRRIGVLFELLPGMNADGPRFAEFVHSVLQATRGPVTFVWDRLAVHRAAEVREVLAKFPRASVVWLPPYAPELNPVEGIWCNGKAREMRGYCGNDELEIAERVEGSLRRQCDDRRILRGHVRQTGLRIPGII